MSEKKLDIAGWLASKGIRLRSLRMGNQYTTCPHCSHKRKKANQKLKCLSVKIDEAGVVYSCKHCGETDYHNDPNGSPHQGNRSKRPERRDGGGYGSLQRQALARWVRRT